MSSSKGSSSRGSERRSASIGTPWRRRSDDANVGILILSVEDMKALSNTMRRRLEMTPRPVVIAVGKKEEEDLREKIKRAIGVDLYK